MRVDSNRSSEPFSCAAIEEDCTLGLVIQIFSDSTPQGSPGVGRNTFLSSPHLCFIIVFICDLFVSSDDPMMS